MKKFMIALVAMFAMTMSANAQSNDNNESHVTTAQIASYLDLRINQQEAFNTAMEQFNSSMAAVYNLQDPAKGMEAWQKVKSRHEKRMQKVLDEKQYEKYMKMFELTAKNTAERLTQQQSLANR